MKHSSHVRDITLLFAFLALSNAIGSAQSVTAYNGSAGNLSTGISYLIYFDDSLLTQVIPTPSAITQRGLAQFLSVRSGTDSI